MQNIDNLNNIIESNYEKYISNIMNYSKKFKVNTTRKEAMDIISNCYIKIYDIIGKNEIKDIKNYFGRMTYNNFCDYLKSKNKIRFVELTEYNQQEFEQDEEVLDKEVEHNKLILEILNKLSDILSPTQFDIFIQKAINGKTCKTISKESKYNYIWTTQEFREANRIVKETFGEKYEDIKKNIKK